MLKRSLMKYVHENYTLLIIVLSPAEFTVSRHQVEDAPKNTVNFAANAGCYKWNMSKKKIGCKFSRTVKDRIKLNGKFKFKLFQATIHCVT